MISPPSRNPSFSSYSLGLPQSLSALKHYRLPITIKHNYQTFKRITFSSFKNVTDTLRESLFSQYYDYSYHLKYRLIHNINYKSNSSLFIVVFVQPSSHVQLFATPWTEAHRPSCPSPSPKICPSSCPFHQ